MKSPDTRVETFKKQLQYILSLYISKTINLSSFISSAKLYNCKLNDKNELLEIINCNDPDIDILIKLYISLPEKFFTDILDDEYKKRHCGKL